MRRRGVAVALAGAVAAVAVGAIVTLGAGGGTPAAEPVATTEPEVAFAPLVHLHRDETAFPISAARFIYYGKLKWASEDCSDTTVALGRGRVLLGRDPEQVPTIEPERLGGLQPYVVRPRDDVVGCPRRTDGLAASYVTAEHTRPFDPGRRGGLRPGDGFFLDLLTAELGGVESVGRRAGQAVLNEAPVYYERRDEDVDGDPGVRITYWLLYGANAPPGLGDDGYLVTHEGDWERVSVLARRESAGRWTPVSVRYHVERRVEELPWEEVEHVVGPAGDPEAARPARSHPVVYATLGGHTPRPRPGPHGRTVRADGRRATLRERAGAACRDCPQWRTWGHLRNATRQPWYGFGGAWGYVHETDANSGPPGPSPYRGR